MAIRFARQSGNWNDPNIWDGGVSVPQTGDTVLSNSFNITLDVDINVDMFSDTWNLQGTPLSPIPSMISNTTPVGVGQSFASSNNTDSWRVFRKDLTSGIPSFSWTSAGVPAQLGFQFNTVKNIQRYSWYQNSSGGNRPRNWTFEGSNDGSNWTILHTVTNSPNTATYFSPIISNPSSFTYYRINMTATQGSGTFIIDLFDMTESTDILSSGYTSGGSLISSNNRQLTFTGKGLAKLPSSLQTTFLLINGTSTTTTIVGNVDHSFNNTSQYSAVNFAGGNNILNITGDVFMPSNVTNCKGYVINCTTVTNTINITGNLYTYSNNTEESVVVRTTGVINVIGNVTSYSTFTNTLVRVVDGGTVRVTGNITGPNNRSFTITSTSSLLLSGNLICVNERWPVSVTNFQLISNSPNSITFQTENPAINRTLYSSGVPLGNPVVGNVKKGTVYGGNNELTGTMNVPPPGSVTAGVLVDNTVGTAIINAEEMWNYDMSNSMNEPGTLGYKLKKMQPQILSNVGNIVT